MRLAEQAKGVISHTLRHVAPPNTDHALRILGRPHRSVKILDILSALLVVDSAHFIWVALHFLVICLLVFRKFGLVDACFGVKTILEEVTLLVELLVDVGSLQEVALDEGLLMEYDLLLIHGGPFGHQLPPRLTIWSSESPLIGLRYYRLLSGPIDGLSYLVFLIISSRFGTRIAFDHPTLAEVTKMVILARVAKLSNTILRFVIPILILLDDLLYSLPLNTSD